MRNRDGGVLKEDAARQGRTSRSSVEPNGERAGHGGLVGSKEPKHEFSAGGIVVVAIAAAAAASIANGNQSSVHVALKGSKGGFRLLESFHEIIGRLQKMGLLRHDMIRLLLESQNGQC